MTIEPRQRLLLWVLGGLLIIIGWNKLGHLRFGGGGDAGPVANRGTVRERPVTTDVVGLDLSLLNAPAGEFELGRDPFRYGVVPQPPAPVVTIVETPPEPEPVREIPVEPPGPVPPSVDHFTYLGSFGREGGKIAVLISGEDIYNLREGESFEESFSIEEIGYESVAIGFVDFPDVVPKRLPVGG